MSREGNRRRVLTSEERVLWTAVTKAIAPLRSPASPAAGEGGKTAIQVAEPARAVAEPIKVAVSERLAPPPLAPLGRRLRQRVTRGREAIDARLDLHGLTLSEAHAALLRFLRSAHARNARLVLVITGKGQRGEGEGERERGVLRRHVPQWLGLPEFRTFVVGFEDAHVAHGGEGALYVRLRRPQSGKAD